MRNDPARTSLKRHLANHLVRGLRAGSRYWQPIFGDDEDAPALGGPPTFRILGAGRSPHRTIEGYVFRIDAPATVLPTSGGPVAVTERRITLKEARYEAALVALGNTHLDCGCHGFPGTLQRLRERSTGEVCCALAGLYGLPFRAWVDKGDGLRVAPGVTPDMGRASLLLLAYAVVWAPADRSFSRPARDASSRRRADVAPA